MMDVWLLIHEHPGWVWMAFAAVFLTVELATGSGWLLWPAAAAGITAIAVAAFRFNPTTQTLVFALFTVVFTYAGRRWVRARAHSASDDLNDAAARLIGRLAETASPFHSGSGRVFIDGKEWSAELEGGGAAAKGARVEVIALLGGSRLKVRSIP